MHKHYDRAVPLPNRSALHRRRRLRLSDDLAHAGCLCRMGLESDHRARRPETVRAHAKTAVCARHTAGLERMSSDNYSSRPATIRLPGFAWATFVALKQASFTILSSQSNGGGFCGMIGANHDQS